MDGGEPRAAVMATAGKVVGFGLFLLVLLAPNPDPDQLSGAGWRLAAVTVLMAVLWLTQAIPIAATALLPLAAFPLLGIQSARQVSAAYIDETIFLFLGGFLIALGIEKWGLHRRIALNVVRLLGTGPRRMVLGFMLATAFLSMWISNTASTLLMLPIVLALVAALSDLAGHGPPSETPAWREAGSEGPGSAGQEIRSSGGSGPEAALGKLSTALLLGVAYSASIGGFTTLVGTPTNVTFVKIWREQFPAGPEFAAGPWTVAVLPVGVLYLLGAWGVLAWRLRPIPGTATLERRFFTDQLKALGRPLRAEWLMLGVFVTTAVLWMLRKPLEVGAATLLPGWDAPMERFLLWLGTDPALAREAVGDSTVAIGMALLMFVLPAARDEWGRTRFLMDWKTAERLPWGILLLIGGGFALANGFSESGLSEWLGSRFAERIQDWPSWLMVGSVCVLMTFLTELTSNVATISTLLPVLSETAAGVGVDPRLIAVPAALAVSCAFMLPIATPPNAIVFGSGRVRMGDMVRHGIVLNLAGVAVITLATFLLLVPQLGISLTEMPAWAIEAAGE